MLKPCHCLQKRRKQSQPHAIQGQRCNTLCVSHLFHGLYDQLWVASAAGKVQFRFLPGLRHESTGTTQKSQQRCGKKGLHTCVYIRIHMYVCMHACIRLSLCARVHVCKCVCVYMYVSASTYLCVCVCARACTRVCAVVVVCVCVCLNRLRHDSTMCTCIYIHLCVCVAKKGRVCVRRCMYVQ